MAISFLDNIGIKKQAPNVQRDLFDTVADMVDWSENWLPDVFECNVKETGQRYRYNVSNTVDEVTGKWRLVEGGGGDLENYYNKTEIDTAFDNAKTDWEKYTDDEIAKLNTDKAIACDEKPTYDSGTITYIVNGEEKTTEDESIWFYYTEDEVLKQTRFIEGVEKTITSGGGVDFDAYVKKEDGAGGISFEDSEHPLWTDVDKAIKGLIAKVEYIKPEITEFTSDAEAIYEIGQRLSSIVFNWTLNKDVTSQTLTDTTVADETVRTATYTTELSANKTFTLTVSDGQNSASKQISVAFRNKIYFGGASEPADYDSAFILGLAKNQFATSTKGSYSANVGSGEYGYIAYPKSFGKISTVWVGGFEYEVVSCGDVLFTNASDFSSAYSVVRMVRPSLGSIVMEVK